MFKRSILLLSFLGCALFAFAQDYPARPNTLVTDYTHTLSDTDRQQLENKLDAFNDSTSTQIAVVIMKTIGGANIEDYGTGLAKSWGIGQKGKNNGILVLVAVDDRKVTIRTGYGAVGAISDKTANQVIQDDLVPRFKVNDFYGGLDAATSHLMELIKNDFTNDNQPQQQQQGQTQGQGAQPGQAEDSGNGVGIIVVIIIVVVVLILIFRNRGGGGGGQIISSRGGASPFWWFLGGSILGNSLGNNGGGWGGSDDGGGYSGGDSGGGDSGGDSGGFGGGDFGGDGSSGSW